MQESRSCVIASCVVSCGLTVPAGAAEWTAPENLAPNPSFEQRDDRGRAVAWSVKAPVFSLSAQDPHSGKACLRHENRDASRYVLCSAPLRLQAGRRYEFEAWVRAEGLAGKDSGATVCIEWWAKDRKYLGGAYPAGVKGTTTQWTRVRGITRPIPAVATGIALTCYVRRGMTGVAWWDDVAVRPYRPPLVEGLVTSAYRNEVAGGAVTVKAALTLSDYGLPPDQTRVEVIVEDVERRRLAASPAAEVIANEATFTVDAETLTPGQYTIRCNVRSTDGRVEGNASCRLTRLAASPARKAWIDEHRRLVLDGKPFFPLGTYWGGVKEQELELYAKSPFNCLMPYGGASREMLDLAHQHGLKVIFRLKDYYFGTGYCPKHIKSVDDERPAIEARIKEVGDHPAIMAWYINDERPLTMLDRLTAHQRWFTELDPSRPTWVVLYQIHQVRSYLPTFDVIGADPYPVPVAPASQALTWTRMTVDGVFNLRAVWMAPQIHNKAAYREDPTYRAPTLREMRSMAWQCIVGGANGLVFYSWFDLWRMAKTDPFEARWKDVTTMAAEIKRLFPVLLSVEPAPTPGSVEAPDGIAWRMYAKDGDAYLVIVNSEDRPATATLAFPNTWAAADTLLGDVPARHADGRIRLQFNALEPKVVRLRQKRGPGSDST